MRIEALAIQNFRGFRQLKLDLDPKFNLLVGNNGSGKTSILDAVYIAAGSWLLGVDGPRRAPAIDEEEVRLVPLQYENGIYSFERQYPCSVKATGIVMGNKTAWTREKVSDRSTTRYSGSVEIRDIGRNTISSMRAGEDVILPLISSYGTERLWIEPNLSTSKESRSKERLSRLEGYRNIQFLINEEALFDWLYSETLASLQSGQDSPAFTVVKNAIVGCIEDAHDLQYDLRRKDIIVVMKRHATLPYEFLSDGQRAMLTLAGDIAKKAITLNPHLGEEVLKKTPGIVTVDELDIHLHPRWQRHVIRDLKSVFPGIQFVASTHSPQLVGEAAPNEVILLDDIIDNDAEKPPNPEQSFGMDSNWILKYVMQAEERDDQIKQRINEANQYILKLEFDSARNTLDDLRKDIGNHPDLVRLSTRIDRLTGKSQ